MLIENAAAYHVFFAVMMGVILYIFTREIIPGGGSGKPKFFICGLAIVVAIYLLFEILPA
ncbi:MAG: hypothetical protein ACTSU5_19375 [Promethearchaeota archaeon]